MAPAFAMAFMMIGCCAILIGLAIHIFVTYLLYSCHQRLPKPFQLMEPGLVWLMLIPIFNIVWQFFVVLRLSTSYQNYFRAQNRGDVGDCGYTIGLVALILSCVSIIPYLGCLTSLASLVLWIIYLVKAVGLRDQIPASMPA
jgi:hypothetical protein